MAGAKIVKPLSMEMETGQAETVDKSMHVN